MKKEDLQSADVHREDRTDLTIIGLKLGFICYEPNKLEFVIRNWVDLFDLE